MKGRVSTKGRLWLNRSKHMNKLRIRFGVRLGWPMQNAGILILYVPADVFAKLEGAVFTLKGALPEAVAARIVCEVS